MWQLSTNFNTFGPGPGNLLEARHSLGERGHQGLRKMSMAASFKASTGAKAACAIHVHVMEPTDRHVSIKRVPPTQKWANARGREPKDREGASELYAGYPVKLGGVTG